MQTALVLFFLTGAYPLWIAWQANRRTSLGHAVCWTVAAWAAWAAWGMVVYRAGTSPGPGLDLFRYLALCLTGCAGVAVLGARRPGLVAWDFVVLGLLGVLLLPVAEDLLATRESLGIVRTLFLAATLAVGILNYLPTRLAPAALALALGAADEFMLLEKITSPASNAWHQNLACLALGLTPWLGLLAWRAAPGSLSAFHRPWHGQLAARGTRPGSPSAFDRPWHAFRDRFGLVWGQRVREQFNHAAANAGWPVHLSWRGLRRLPGTPPPSADAEAAMAATLRALLRRFVGDMGDI